MLKYLSFLFILLLTVPTFAKDGKLFKSFSSENPMSYRFTMSISQDKDGFMWFGAQEGLHRFDGHKLVSYYHEANDPASLSSNVISRIVIDKKQNFWIGTRGGGVNLYTTESNTFRHITTQSTPYNLTNDVVNTVYEDSQGKIWVGTENGLNIIYNENEKWIVKKLYQQVNSDQSLSNNTIHAITETHDGHLWVGTNGGGISIFDLDGNFIKNAGAELEIKDTDTIKFINTLFTDNNHNIWIGTSNKGLIKYETKRNQIQHFEYKENDSTTISSNTIHYVFQDSSNKLWIATDNGLAIYADEKHHFDRYNHAIGDQYSVSNDFIMTLFEDDNGLMWIGTFTGVNRWDPTMTVFNQYTQSKFPIIDSPNITSFAQAEDDQIFFSTYNGCIYTLNTKNEMVNLLPSSAFFDGKRIMSLFAEKEYLWVGTRNEGLFRINLSTKNITAYKHDEMNTSSISANSITDIIRDKNGNLWVSTFYNGLNKFNQNESFTHFTRNSDNKAAGPSNNSILHMLEDEEGIIWLASYGGGLNRFDPKTERFTHILNHSDNASSISSDLTWYLFIDKNKDMWIATQAAGLNILTYEDRLTQTYTFEHVDTQQGLKTHTVYGIEQDNHENMWFSSNQGVTLYMPPSQTFKHFDLSHGLVDLDFNHSAIMKSANGELLFGSGKGISNVDPVNESLKTVAPKVKLTRISKLNEAIDFKALLFKGKNIEFNHNDQLISFEYVGLNYTDPESTRYKYRLLGFEQQWFDAGKSRRATYTNLPAGHYQLQIAAANGDGVWSEPGLTLNIVVKSAPWNTWWAYILYTLVIALLLLFYSRVLNRKLAIEQQQKQELECQVQEKTQKFRTQNIELAQANKQLEAAATIDKLTGVKSRRYLDIYIEQTSQLMNQMHQNLPTVQRNTLPRLYILMIQISDLVKVTDSQIVNLSDLLLYTRNNDDLVVRWSENTFAVIGYENDNNANELVSRLSRRFNDIIDNASIALAYSYYPFSRENPLELTWDQISVLLEQSLTFVLDSKELAWLGLCGPKETHTDYLYLIQNRTLSTLKEQVIVKSGLT